MPTGVILHSARSLDEAGLRSAFKDATCKLDSVELSFEKVWKLLLKLMFEIDRKIAERQFKNFAKLVYHSNSSKKAEPKLVVEESEFVEFMKSISQNDAVLRIFRKYADGKEEPMRLNESGLQQFFQKEKNNDNKSTEYFQELLKQFGQRDQHDVPVGIDIYGFQRLIYNFDGPFHLADRNLLQQGQDMDQPLQNYYISSSHNTYLVAGQLSGKATSTGYALALGMGTRLVEVDLWNGDDGDPVVSHGGTLVKPVRLKEVAETIADHAFKKSQFPLIISLENHACLLQQQKSAAIFREAFGDHLLLTSLSMLKQLPSPNYLKQKILIKAGGLLHEDLLAIIALRSAKLQGGLEFSISNRECTYFEPIFEMLKKCGVARSQKFMAHTPDAVNAFTSLKESSEASLRDENYSGLLRYTSKHLLKIYPSGLRTASSNMDPIPLWLAGAQIVAMNMQTPCTELDVHQSFFLQNNDSGYVLKPDYIRNATLSRDGILECPIRQTLVVKVICGHYIPKPQETSNLEDIVDPYVKVQLFGVSCDSKEERTTVVKNNGLNPIWNQFFQFPLRFAELAVLRICVRDADLASTEFIGQFSCPITCLSQGLCSCPLYSPQHHRIPGAALLLKVALHNGPAANTIASIN